MNELPLALTVSLLMLMVAKSFTHDALIAYTPECTQLYTCVYICVQLLL